jgi:hypothetical protein
MKNIIQNIPAIDYDRMGQAIAPFDLFNQPVAIASTSTTRPSHKRSNSDPIRINMNEGIDPEIIAKYKFQMPNDIIKDVALDTEKLTLLSDKQKDIANKIKLIALKSGKDKSLKYDLEILRMYNQAVKTILDNQTFIKKSTSSLSGKGVKNRIYYTNLNELFERLKVLIGQIQAGNNSKKIKNELSDVAHHLYKNKCIKMKDYRNILTQL